jgi:hypothetical protein
MADPTDPPQRDAIDRRSFIERLAVLAAVGDVGRRVQPDAGAEATAAAPAGTLNGIQMGPHTILDEGIDRTLDLVADTAATNAVMPYSHGLSGQRARVISAGSEVPGFRSSEVRFRNPRHLFINTKYGCATTRQSVPIFRTTNGISTGPNRPTRTFRSASRVPSTGGPMGTG